MDRTNFDVFLLFVAMASAWSTADSWLGVISLLPVTSIAVLFVASAVVRSFSKLN